MEDRKINVFSDHSIMGERGSFAGLKYCAMHWETVKHCQLCVLSECGTVFRQEEQTLAQSSLDGSISPAEGKDRENLLAG